MHRVRAGEQHTDQSVAGLVVCGIATLFHRHDHRAPFRAHHDLVLGELEIALLDLFLVAARRQQRGLIHQVFEIRTGKTRRRAREAIERDLIGKRDLARMHPQNSFAPFNVRPRHHDAPIETAGPEQCGIEDIGTVGRGNQDHALVRFEAVHLDQQLIQGLLALVVTAAEARAAMASDGVDFVNEDDAGRMLLTLNKQIADARSAHADKHFNEIRS